MGGVVLAKCEVTHPVHPNNADGLTFVPKPAKAPTLSIA